MRRIVVATHNAHKVAELERILVPLLPDVTLETYDGPEPVEDGATFEANALIKARAAFRHSGIPALADDSGIAVDALGGEPGIHSARYAGTRVDSDNLALLLERMRSKSDRSAQFVCAAAYVDEHGEHVVVGTWPGRLSTQPRGVGGFGYDPIFLPDDAQVSAAELSPAEKDAKSHRRQAFERLAEQIR